MKQVLLFSSLFLTLVMVKPTQAQVSVQVNIGSQPQWGPVGYDYVDYYYLPDIETYYYIPTRQFIYLEGDRWIFSANLPYRCRNYDLFGGYKVVITGRDPYRNHWEYRNRYAPNCYRGSQIIIRDRGYGYGRNRNYNQPYQYRRDYFETDRRAYDYSDDDNRKNRGRDRDEDDNYNRNNKRHHGHGNGRGHGRRGW
jgi:hypothetical protein